MRAGCGGRYVHEYCGETRESAEVFVECVDSTPLHPDEKVPPLPTSPSI